MARGNRCNPAVKALLKNHYRCNKVRSTSAFSGYEINSYLGISTDSGLDINQQYNVCYNVACNIRSHADSITNPTINQQQPHLVSSPSTASLVILPCRSPQLNLCIVSAATEIPVLWRSPRLENNSSQKNVSVSAQKRLKVHKHHTQN